MKIALVCAGLLLIVVTVLPFIPTAERWIRIFDFPRAQLAILLLITTLLFLVVLRRAPADFAMLAVLLAALFWQAFRIFPYTPLAPTQVQAAARSNSEACFTLVVANVLMENRNAEGLIDILRDADPDVVLLVETDEWWDRAMSTLGNSHPHSVHQPQDNHYGMVLYSRIPFETSDIEFLIDENIPSIHAGLKLPSGDVVAFYGVHPVPPPLADTTERDAELLVVGKLARESGRPAIVAGDLNDVGWSATTRLFQRISGLLDPRHGRGFFASYNAKNPILRWPLDHVFHDAAFTVRDLRLLAPFGSDHFPVFLHLCRNPGAEDEQDLPRPDVEDKVKANRAIREGKSADPGPDEYPHE